jgi:hypothetical protein
VKRPSTLLVFLAVFVSASVFATSFPPLTLEELVRPADDVLRAAVVRRRTSLEAGRLFTHTTVRITRVFKGDHRVGDALVLRQSGGVRGLLREGIVGDARLEDFEDVVLILRHGERYHHLTNLALSKFRVSAAGGSELLWRDLSGLSFARAGAHDGAQPSEPVSFEQLERALAASEAR